MKLKKYILDVRDFPKKGVIFKDLTGILKNPIIFKKVIDELSKYSRDRGAEVICAVESRGFWFAPQIAINLGIPFVPIRKKGKLPSVTISQEYDLEYGKGSLEIHKNAIKKNQKVIIFDDILATGGTIEASIKLIERLGGIVIGCSFLATIKFLKGHEALETYDWNTLVTF